jgi:hypothetical protein
VHSVKNCKNKLFAPDNVPINILVSGDSFGVGGGGNAATCAVARNRRLLSRPQNKKIEYTTIYSN